MYQVITMYGDNEPWWFFEDWEETIKEKNDFERLEDAQAYYERCWVEFSKKSTYHNVKPNYMSAFWDDGDERWCEECDDYLQQYWGLAILEDNKPLTIKSSEKRYEETNTIGQIKSCKGFRQGV